MVGGLSLAATFPSFVFNAIFYCDTLELQLFQQVPVVSARSADIKIKQLEQYNKLPTLVSLSCPMLANGLSSSPWRVRL